MSNRILIIDDEAPIREMVVFALERQGFQVSEAADTRQAMQQIETQMPELLLLDWMLPGISGVEFLRRLRRSPATAQLPVIMLTARGEEEDRIQGLELGADDYISKPFSTRELATRIKAVLRRYKAGSGEELLTAGDLSLDAVSHRVTVGDQAIELGPTEFRLLRFFMNNPERVYTRAQLLDHVWGENVYVEERTVDVHIRRLRKALAPSGHDNLVQTVRGSGYRFSLKV